MENDAQELINSAEICAYYKERYDEVKTSYRRMEDKVNNLLTALVLEVSVILAVCGGFADAFDDLSKLSTKFFILFMGACCVFLGFSVYYLGHSWRPMPMANMPTQYEAQAQISLLNLPKKKVHGFLISLYAEAVSEINKIHSYKVAYVGGLFLYLSLSYVFLVMSIISLVLRRV